MWWYLKPLWLFEVYMAITFAPRSSSEYFLKRYEAMPVVRNFGTKHMLHAVAMRMSQGEVFYCFVARFKIPTRYPEHGEFL